MAVRWDEAATGRDRKPQAASRPRRSSDVAPPSRDFCRPTSLSISHGSQLTNMTS